MLENFVEVVDSAETGRFRSDEGTAVAHALAGDDAVFPNALDPLVLTVKISDFTSAYADIARGDIDVGTDVSLELGHERLAESHDLCVALARGVEIASALSAAYRKTGKAVLEDLLETEELHNADIYRGMETETALVRTDSGIELNSVTAVDSDFAFVVDPGDSERYLSLGLGESFKKTGFLVFGMCVYNFFERGKDFFDGLDEFRFGRVARFYRFNGSLNVSIHD